MKPKLFISAGIALCILAEGADENLLREIEESHVGVMQQCIPTIHEVLVALTRQADAQKVTVQASFSRKDSDFRCLCSLSKKGRRVLEKLYALQNRKVIFLSNTLFVHPKGKIEDALRRQYASAGKGFYLCNV